MNRLRDLQLQLFIVTVPSKFKQYVYVPLHDVSESWNLVADDESDSLSKLSVLSALPRLLVLTEKK